MTKMQRTKGATGEREPCELLVFPRIERAVVRAETDERNDMIGRCNVARPAAPVPHHMPVSWSAASIEPTPGARICKSLPDASRNRET